MNNRHTDKNIIYNFKFIPMCVLIFLMLFLPTIYSPIKSILLFFILIGVTLNYIKSKQIFLDFKILLFALINLLSCSFFILWGIINNTPGATKTNTIYIIYPIIYIYLIGYIKDNIVFQKILTTLVISGLFIGMYSIYCILYFTNILPESIYIELPLDQALGVYEGFFEFRIYSLSSLIFIVPVLIGMLFYYDKATYRIGKKCIQITLVIDLTVMILSARKGLYLSVLFSLPMFFFFKKHSFIKNLKWSAIMSLLLVGVSILLVGFYFDLDYSKSIDDFKAGFEFDNVQNESAYVRTQQFSALLNGWKDSPWIGYGIGASASFRSSEDQPWAYELTYLALLFQIGIIGMVIIGFSYLRVLWVNYINIKSDDNVDSSLITPLFVATICFLIANATNPYLAKFDYLWIMFLPIATANYYLTRSKTDL